MNIHRVLYEGIDRDYEYGLCYCSRKKVEEISKKKCEATFVDGIAYFCNLEMEVLSHESLHITFEILRKTVDDINFNSLLINENILERNIGEEAIAYTYSEVFKVVEEWAKRVKIKAENSIESILKEYDKDHLERIKNLDCNDSLSSFETLLAIFRETGYGSGDISEIKDDFSGTIVPVLHLHTGGWSECERMIYDLENDNKLFWIYFWYSTIHGGHYEFRGRSKQ